MHPLWEPSPERIANARMTAFMREVSARTAQPFANYSDLYHYSIDHPAEFWRDVWTFCGIRGEMGGAIVEDLHKMPGARFFPGTPSR